jgi:hypothetical protein
MSNYRRPRSESKIEESNEFAEIHKELLKAAVAATFPAEPFPTKEQHDRYCTNIVGVTEVITAKFMQRQKARRTVDTE